MYDSDLGLYYLRARYYNPVTGRFVSRDPGKLIMAAHDANQEINFYLFGGDQ